MQGSTEQSVSSVTGLKRMLRLFSIQPHDSRQASTLTIPADVELDRNMAALCQPTTQQPAEYALPPPQIPTI
jgi:hypothetical protein